jgi:hypothetical protein
MAQVSVMRANVRDFADVDQTDVSDAFITRALNAAYMELIGDASWPFLLSRGTLPTTSGVVEYAVGLIAANCEAHRIRRVQQAGLDLDFVAPEQYYDLNPFGGTGVGSTGGQPRWWSVLESVTLAIWPPPPNGSARVIYVRKPADLVLDGDVPETPTRYDDVLETGALARVFQKIGDLDSSEIKKKEFTDAVGHTHADLLRTQETSPLIFGGDDNPPTLLPPLMDWSYVH